MPYRSLAQARKFHSDPKLRRYAAEYDAATDFSKLPDRVRPKGKRHHFKHGVLHELTRSKR
jgi:hypothetical protein